MGDKEPDGFIEQTKTKISEFFAHMIQYGIFNYKDGEITVFNNPYLFIPISALATIQYELNKVFPKEANTLIEWIGRVDGRTASNILVKRYGIDPKNIRRLLDAGTLTGLGKLDLKKVEEEEIIVTCINSPFAKYYKKKYGISKEPVDYYILGALVGSDIPITGREAVGKELFCIGKGDKYCEYQFLHGKYKRPSLIKKYLKKDPDKILNEISSKFIRRMKFSSVSFKFKDIKFGDGNFIFNNILGISIPAFAIILLNELLLNYDPKFRDEFFIKVSESYIEDLDIPLINTSKFSSKQIQSIINNLSMFGFGSLKVRLIRNKKILFENFNNNYAKEYIEIFGYKKESSDILLCKLIEIILRRSLNRSLSCIEKSCISNKNNNFCLFEVNIK